MKKKLVRRRGVQAEAVLVDVQTRANDQATTMTPTHWETQEQLQKTRSACRALHWDA
jgi:hypothetical protein